MPFTVSEILSYKIFQIYITKGSKSSIGLFFFNTNRRIYTHYRGIVIYHLFIHIRVEQIDSAFSKRAIMPFG